MEQTNKVEFVQLTVAQTKLYEENLKYHILRWEILKRDFEEGSLFQQIREKSQTIPEFWYFVFYNCNFLTNFDDNPYLELVFKELVDVNVINFEQKLEGTPMLSNIKMYCTLQFKFKENKFFTNETLSLTLVRNSLDENEIDIINDNNQIEWLDNYDKLLMNQLNNNNDQQNNPNDNNETENNQQDGPNVVGLFSFFDLFTKDFKKLTPKMKETFLFVISMILNDILPNCVHCFKGSLTINHFYNFIDDDDEENGELRRMLAEINERINDIDDEIERNTNDINDIWISNDDSDEEDDDDEESDE